MRRREFITLIGGAAVAWTLAARAQPAGKVWRIGMLDTTGEAAKSADISAFRRGLAELGYTEEKNLIIDYRSADGRPERFPALVAELLSRKVDLIVTRGTPAAVAAKEATSTIPVIMAAIADPLLVVRSLARPGGNLTGFSSLLIDLPSKQAELVKEMVPGLTRVGSISNMSNAAARAIWKEFQEATAIAGIEAHLLDVRTPSDIGLAVSIHLFASALNSSTDMPVSVAARIFSRSRIESLAIASRLPESTVLNGSTFLSSGFSATTAGTRSRQ
jgi:putative tryptophan/tyrosine transport system substrate-binding protein